jgi:hypothetical protein
MRAKFRIVLSTALFLFSVGCVDKFGDKTNPGDGDGIGTSPSVTGHGGSLEQPNPLPPQCTVNGPIVSTPGSVLLCPKK